MKKLIPVKVTKPIFDFTIMPSLVVFDEEPDDPMPMPYEAIINQVYAFGTIPVHLINNKANPFLQECKDNLPEEFQHKKVEGILICVQYTKLYLA